MTNNMITKIIYQKRWMLFWWFIALVATALSTTVFFPEFKGTNISQVFNSLPASVQHIAGSADSFKTIGGYISQEVFGLRAPLLMIILSIVVFNSLSTGEERRGILETQISLPLSRSKIFFSKFFAAIFIIVIASAGLFVGVVIALAIIHDHYSLIRLLQLVIDSTVIGILFGLVTFMLNAIFGIRGIVLGLSCAYAFVSYLLTSLALTNKSVRLVEKGSPFHYYSYSGNFYLNELLILVYIALALTFIAYVFFTRRDIET
jgi:ABC-2 type transport system permease protein